MYIKNVEMEEEMYAKRNIILRRHQEDLPNIPIQGFVDSG